MCGTEQDSEDLKFYNVAQLAEMLQVTPDWIYDQVQADKIPFTRVGHFLRFRCRRIEDWLDGNSSG